MTGKFKNLILAICLPIFITACSGTPLQTKRMNTAEDHIIEAERALSGAYGGVDKPYANANVGTASAYLATVYDNRKFLTDNEQKRYQALTQRVEQLKTQVR